MKNYKASFARVRSGKTATFGFKEKSFKSLKKFAKHALKFAWIPVTVTGGWRTYDNVTEVHNWLRFDCDMKGEKETITSILKSKGISYVALPSTNYNKKTKSHKWHISVPTRKASQDVMKYKWQVIKALNDLGIDLHDRRVTEVCVQNMNPYKNGKDDEKGLGFVEVFEGSEASYKLSKAPDYLKFNVMSKTKFNGKGDKKVINKKVVRATENFELLHPKSGIKIDKVGWTTLDKLNLDVGGIIGGLSCPAHNTKHDGGKGAHTCGYAFASMDEGGTVWIKCTGAECKGKSYRMDAPDFGAYTKLSDLFELRKFVSLTAYDFNKSAMYSMTAEGSYNFRWKEINDFIGSDIFFKVDLTLTETVTKDIDLIKAKLATATDLMVVDELEGRIRNTISAYEDKILKETLGGNRQLEKFKKEYPSDIDGLGNIIESSVDKYVKCIKANVERHIRATRQYNSVAYSVNPYANEMTGLVANNELRVTINNKISLDGGDDGTDSEFVADYIKHNPYLDDMLEMIMAQKFGADKKTSYLWLHCDSNWGKSFLFEGVLKELAYDMNPDETKKALKGDPSGINVTELVKSSMIFFDEFKSAVSELKNIAFQMHVTPKQGKKTTVPVGMKIFASAESVNSLISSQGNVEEQFRNRFLYIRAYGDLTTREVYRLNKAEYTKAVHNYCVAKMYDIQQRYLIEGSVDGTRRADEVYMVLANKYTIKNSSTSLADSLPDMFDDWITGIRAKLNVMKDGIQHYDYHDVLSFHKKSGELHIKNMDKCKSLFISEFVGTDGVGAVKHKSMAVIVGETKVSSLRYNKVKVNTRVLV